MSHSLPAMHEPAPQLSRGPFRGLAPFDTTDVDALFFFGRGHEQDVLIANLISFPLTVLYGPSGVGKSSLLRAGVAHRLLEIANGDVRRQGRPEFAVIVFGSWTTDPVKELRAAAFDAVSELTGTLPPLPADSSLGDALRLLASAFGGQLYVILDQFEEYFLYHESDLPDDPFALEFPAAVNDPELPAHFLVSVREDALAKLDRFKGSIPGLFANYLRLDRLDRDEAEMAVLGPVDRYNAMVEPPERIRLHSALVDEVLEQVAAGRVDPGYAGRGGVEGGGDSRVEAPYLQLVMQRLWEECRRRGDRELGPDLLRDLGGAGRIVRSHVEQALAGLDPDEMSIAARIFNHLITPSGSKIALGTGDLGRYAGVAEEQVRPLLARLADERILRPVASRGNAEVRYEIFHDVLADALLAWRSDFERRRDLELERAGAARRHRRLLVVVAAAGIALALMSVLTVVALTQWQQARRERGEARAQARLAESRELSARAVNAVSTDPEESLRLGLRAAGLAPTREAADALRRALLNWRLRWILGPHGGRVLKATYSPDGRRVATASRDGRARIFDARTGELETVLRHDGPVMEEQFDNSGRFLATASRDGNGRVWRADDGRLLMRLNQGAPLNAIDISRDGAHVVTGGDDGTARIWDAHSGKPVLALETGAKVQKARFNPSGRLLVTIGDNGLAVLWRVSDGRRLKTLSRLGVRSAAFSDEGGLLATGNGNGTTLVWDSQSGLLQRIAEPFGHRSGTITAVAFRRDGDRLVTGSTDGVARIWRPEGGQRVSILRDHTNYITSAAFSPDGRFVVTGSRDRTARIWEPDTGRTAAVLIGHRDTVRTVEFNRSGTSVVTSSDDRTARIWDATAHDRLALIGNHAGPVTAMAITADGGVAVSAGQDGIARVFDPATGKPLARLVHGAAIATVAVSPDGRLIATGGTDGYADVWETETGRLAKRFDHSASLSVVRFGATSRSLVTAGADGSARIWAVEGTGPPRLFDHGQPIAAAALSPDGSRLVTAARAGGARLWSTDGRLIRVLKMRPRPLAAASFSPTGRILVTAGTDGVARFWSARNGGLLRELKGHHGGIAGAAFSGAGDRLVTAGLDHDARIWRVSDGRLLHVLRGHFASLAGATFSPDGEWVVTAGPSTAGLWEVDTGALLLLLRGHDGRLTAASFAGGESILTGGVDGTVRKYRCVVCGSIEDLVNVARARLRAARRPVGNVQSG